MQNHKIETNSGLIYKDGSIWWTLIFIKIIGSDTLSPITTVRGPFKRRSVEYDKSYITWMEYNKISNYDNNLVLLCTILSIQNLRYKHLNCSHHYLGLHVH